MMLASALIHLALLGLFLLEWRGTPPQASSPPSVEIMADPQQAADIADDRAPDRPSDKPGEPTASDAPIPPPVPQEPQPPAEPVSPQPAQAEPAPPEPVAAEPAPPGSASADPVPPPPASAEVPSEPLPQVQVAPEPVTPEAALPPPQEAPPAAAPRSGPPAVNLNLAPPEPMPPPTMEPPPPLPPQPIPRASRPPSFPAPIISSWNANPFAAQPQRQARGTKGVDLSLGPVASASRGAPPRGPQDIDSNIRVVGAQVGPDWIRLMQEWWVRHRYYPTQAAQNGEAGTVQVHLDMDRLGRVLSVRIESTSGSQWLDAGALSIFRNAQLPPFPSGTPEPRADLHLTLNFYLIRR